jgi:hypothetical protein
MSVAKLLQGHDIEDNGIIDRLRQELSTASSQNEAADIFRMAEQLVSEDELDSFTAYCADIIRELPE